MRCSTEPRFTRESEEFPIQGYRERIIEFQGDTFHKALDFKQRNEEYLDAWNEVRPIPPPSFSRISFYPQYLVKQIR